jgi:hypothetical protein
MAGDVGLPQPEHYWKITPGDPSPVSVGDSSGDPTRIRERPATPSCRAGQKILGQRPPSGR